MSKIDCLIISSTLDYSTDLVCYKLFKRGAKYYRLNRDEFRKHEIEMDLQKQVLLIKTEGLEYTVEFDSLKGVYFRAPVFLRTQSKKILTLDEQLERNQWSAFIRNLSVFQNATWINSPNDTYKAENKMLQLCVAKNNGLKVPETYLSNATNQFVKENSKFVVKSLDTALFYDFDNDNEMFTYSNVVDSEEFQKYELSQAPVIIQELLEPKIDCRVTYVNGKMFPVKILYHGKGLAGDWRCKKDGLDYMSFALPDVIKFNIDKMMKSLNLKFGGIDLALCNDNYYFIEVNPTGEWGWLETVTGLNISDVICDAMMR